MLDPAEAPVQCTPAPSPSVLEVRTHLNLVFLGPMNFHYKSSY